VRAERQNKRPFYKCLSPIELPGYGGRVVSKQAGRQVGIFMGAPVSWTKGFSTLLVVTHFRLIYVVSNPANIRYSGLLLKSRLDG
jgi:hypothetical protein